MFSIANDPNLGQLLSFLLFTIHRFYSNLQPHILKMRRVCFCLWNSGVFFFFLHCSNTYEKNNKTVCDHNNASIKQKPYFVVVFVSKMPMRRMLVEYILPIYTYIFSYISYFTAQAAIVLTRFLLLFSLFAIGLY